MKWLHTLLAVLGGLGLGYLLFSPAKHEAEQTPQTPAITVQSTWTCAMHPHIRRQEVGRCPICDMDLIPLDQSANVDPQVLTMTEQAVALARIATTEVGQGMEGADTIVLNGKIQADERRTATQTAHVPGRIEQLFVTFTGERVQAGQQLAVIYSPELVATQQELLEALRFAGMQMDLAEACRNKMRNWKIPEETIQHIQSTGEILTQVTIRADQAGLVLDKRVQVGDYIRPGDALFTLADLSRLWVLFDVYEEDLARVRTGDRVSFTTPSLPGRTFSATISFIDPLLDARKRVAAARAEIANPGNVLKPEMFVRGAVVHRPAVAGSVITVPKTAVLWTGQRSVVYVEVAEAAVPSYQYREVALGDRLGDSYVIQEGLAPGERVVTNGAFAVDAAAQLSNRSSMMNRRVQAGGRGTAPAAPDFQAEVPEQFRQQMAALVVVYLRIKDALVQSDVAGAKPAAAGMIAALGEMDSTLLEGAARRYWMLQQAALSEHAANIGQADGIEEQRRQFDALSQALIRALKAFGSAGRGLYVQHCPMAFNHRGADWISVEEAIRNPYFGHQMLRCGSVLEQLGE